MSADILLFATKQNSPESKACNNCQGCSRIKEKDEDLMQYKLALSDIVNTILAFQTAQSNKSRKRKILG